MVHVVIATNYEHYRNAYDRKFDLLNDAVSYILSLSGESIQAFFLAGDDIDNCFAEYGLDPDLEELDCCICICLYQSNEDDLSECVDWDQSRLIASWYGDYCVDTLGHYNVYRPLDLDTIDKDASDYERQLIVSGFTKD